MECLQRRQFQSLQLSDRNGSGNADVGKQRAQCAPGMASKILHSVFAARRPFTLHPTCLIGILANISSIFEQTVGEALDVSI